MGTKISVPVVAPLDIEAILKAEKEAKRTRVFLLRNAGLPTCPRRIPQMRSLREVDLSSNRIVELPYELGEFARHDTVMPGIDLAYGATRRAAQDADLKRVAQLTGGASQQSRRLRTSSHLLSELSCSNSRISPHACFAIY